VKIFSVIFLEGRSSVLHIPHPFEDLDGFGHPCILQIFLCNLVDGVLLLALNGGFFLLKDCQELSPDFQSLPLRGLLQEVLEVQSVSVQALQPCSECGVLHRWTFSCWIGIFNSLKILIGFVVACGFVSDLLAVELVLLRALGTCVFY